MSARAIVSGAVHKAAEERTSKAGTRFSTFTLREKVNGSTRWWQAIAFSESAIEALKELAVGDPIAVSGEIDCELWTPEGGGEPRLSWKITADAVLSAKAKPKQRAGREVDQPGPSTPNVGKEGRTMPEFLSDLRAIARALGGEVVGQQVLAPGPGHSRQDRSLSIRLSATAPEGFLAFSHAGDDFAVCRDYVKRALGVAADAWRGGRVDLRCDHDRPPDDDDRTRPALALWRQGVDPRVPLVERYLASRGLELGDDIAGEVLRWHPGIRAMLALFRDSRTDEPRAICRTFLDHEGRKIERKFLGPVRGCAVKLDADEETTHRLHVGEGVETCLAARQLGLRPTWALGSAGAVAAFPVLGRIECLTLLAEHCEVNARAVEQCAARWHEAGREVFIIEPKRGKDLNDAILLRGLRP